MPDINNTYFIYQSKSIRARIMECIHQCYLRICIFRVWFSDDRNQKKHSARQLKQERNTPMVNNITKLKQISTCLDRWFCSRLHPRLQYSHESRRKAWTVEVSSCYIMCFFPESTSNSPFWNKNDVFRGPWKEGEPTIENAKVEWFPKNKLALSVEMASVVTLSFTRINDKYFYGFGLPLVACSLWVLIYIRI